MNPNEFWNADFKQIIIYCQANLARINDEFRKDINLQEAVSNKSIEANPLMFKNPKIKSLIEVFSNLFEEIEEQQSLEEQRKILRG